MSRLPFCSVNCRFRSALWWGAIGMMVATLSARAQLPSAELHTVTPPVVKAGETTTLTLTGANLEDLEALHFSAPGLTASPVLLPESEFRIFPARDGTRFSLTVPADFPEGVVELRASGHFGITTSRPLTIVSANTTVQQDEGALHHSRETAPGLAPGTTAWGRTDSNQVDWWKLSAKKGQRLLIHCRSEAIDSRADATLVLVDGSSVELEKNRDHSGRDPFLDFTAPRDGDFWIGVSDFLYQGGTEYPYLLSVSEGPWIDALLPPAGEPGEVLEATLLGRNLDGGSPGEGLTLDGKPLETKSVRITVPENPDDPWFSEGRPMHALVPGFAYRDGESNSLKVGLTTAPVISVRNDSEIPPVTPPSEISAAFEAPGDRDQFRFRAQPETTYWVEVIGDRLGGRIDPYLVVEKVTRNDEGIESLANVRDDDDEGRTVGARFDAASRDGLVSFQADSETEYQVTVINQFDGGSPLDQYRLSIREATPDFELVGVTERAFHDGRQAYPATPFLRKGGTALLKVLVLRKDGFAGPISLQASGLPEGVTCPPVIARNGEDTVSLVFHASPEASPWAGSVQIHGKAQIGEKAVERSLRTGSLVWGTGDTAQDRVRSRLDLTLPLAVSATESAPVHFGLATEGPLEVTLGEKLEIPIKVHSRNGVKGNLSVAPFGLRGLTKPPAINVAENATEGKLTLDFRKQPNVFSPAEGTWNFVLRATGTTRFRHHPEAAERAAEEKKLTETLATRYTEEATEAKAASSKAKQQLDLATQKLAGASEEAKGQAEKAMKEAKAAWETAEASFQAAEAKRIEADKAKAAAAARAKATADKAKEKDLKFAAYSLPITVVVKPAPEE